MSQIQPFEGGTLTAREKLNGMVQVVNAILHQAGDGYIQLQRGADGITFRLAVDRLLPRLKSSVVRDYFFAKLTGESAGRYAWSEVLQDTTGAWAVKPDGRSGTTSTDYAKEFSNSEGIYDAGTDTYVLMFALNKEGEGVAYRFPAAAGPALRYLVVDSLLTAAGGAYTDYETDGFIGGVEGHPPDDEETSLKVKLPRSNGWGALSSGDYATGLAANDTIAYLEHTEGDWAGTMVLGIEDGSPYVAAVL